MGLESGTYVDDLITTNPVGSTDGKSQGDDHLRLIKSTLKATFPNADRAFRFEEAPAAKTANYSVLAADQRKLITVDASSGDVTVDFPAIAGLFAGWVVTIMRVDDGSANDVTLDPSGVETINGATTYTLNLQYEFVTLMVQNSSFKIVGVGGDVSFGTDTGDIPVLGANGLDSTVHGSAVPVGFMGDWASATPPTGWHTMNGDTIGSASSGATHAAATEEALFTYMWDNFANAEAPVSSGRGASAAADWAANKTITIPDWSGVYTVGAGSAQVVTEDVLAASVSAANDTFTVASNTQRWITGMVVQVSTDGALPTGLSASTDYYIIRDSATTVQFATSLANALDGTVVDITAIGSGTHTLEHTLTSRTVGAWFGEETHAQSDDELRLHGHPYQQKTITENQTYSTNAGAIVTSNNASNTTRTAYTGTPSASVGESIGGSGGSVAMSNVPPTRALYKIIRW